MNIRDLQYIVAVADLQHFGRAAEQCFVSQPTLSGQIKKLEDYLGVTLFERTNKRVIPTAIGLKIIVSARRVLHEADAIKNMAEETKDPFGGKFKLGAFPTLAPYIFSDLVQKIEAEMPSLRLVLVEEKTATLLEKLEKGDLDAALLALPIDNDFLISQPLFTDDFYLAAPAKHPLSQKKSIDQNLLSKHNLLLLEEGHCLRDQALDVCHMNNMAEDQDFKATGIETLRQMVMAGMGITLMPKIAIQENDARIHYIPFTAPAPSRTIGLVWRKTTTRDKILKKIISLF